jgi:hypothetical protein
MTALSDFDVKFGPLSLGKVWEPVFDAGCHRYAHGGRVLPSVSAILKPASTLAYGAIDKDVLAAAADFGTAIHACTEFLDRDELDMESVLPEWKPYLAAYQKWLADAKPDHIAVEWKLCCNRYAGTIDRVSVIGKDFWVVDLKTTSQLHPHVGLQLAAYERLAMPVLLTQIILGDFEAPWDMQPTYLRRAALQLRDDGTYRFREFKRLTDYRAFLGLLNFYEWTKETEND